MQLRLVVSQPCCDLHPCSGPEDVGPCHTAAQLPDQTADAQSLVTTLPSEPTPDYSQGMCNET